MGESGGRPLRVLHVTAGNQRRGAEVFAADLIGATGEGLEHRLAFLHAAPGATVVFPCDASHLPGDGDRAGPVAAWRSLRALAVGFRPDAVQAHGGESLRLAVAAGIGRAVPVVYRRIGMAPAPMLAGWRRRWHQGLMGRATTVVCVADAVRIEALDRFGLDPRRTLTIPNAVDPSRLKRADAASGGARADLGLAADARVVLSFGALSWEKDPLGALDVTADILRNDPRACHVFAGDGPLLAALEARIIYLGLAGRVVVTGSRDDVGGLLAASDVVLFASRRDGMEGMPATIIEAGLAGRPVVAVDVAGVGEVVADGETGILVPHGQPEALRSAVATLLADAGLARGLGAAAAVRCAERFTIAAVAPRYRRVWEAAARRR